MVRLGALVQCDFFADQLPGSQVGSRPVLLFAQLLSATAADAPKTWPHKWLVAFDKAMDVEPGAEKLLALAFGAPELSRWLGGDSSTPSSGGRFAVIAGRYLLTLIDQRGEEAANLTLTVGNR